MTAARCLAVLTLLAAAPVRAGEAERIAAELGSDDRVTRTMAAIALQHEARRRWGFAVLSRTELRDWQRAFQPAVPHLVALLEDDRGLEWVNTKGEVERTTTPHREASLALLALERPSVEPLIGALGHKPLARKADALLRKLTGGGPAEATQGAWQRWWAEHRDRPLRNERGHLGLVLGLAAALAAMIAAIVWRQRAGRRR